MRRPELKKDINELLIMEYLKYTIDKDAIAIRPDYKVIMDKVLEIDGME